MTEQTLLPVTILTGFLGAGKTTLINYLLQNNQNEKIIIIENEFGPINVDSGLLKQDPNIEIVEMTNGCICCSVQGELTEALHRLHQQRLAGEIEFDRLIIETTGLADPAPIIQTFFIDDLIRQTIALDAIVTLVDCEHILQQLDEHRVASSQIGFADRIILTKLDRVTTAQKELVVERIHSINQKASIYAAQQGQLPKAQWLDIHAFDLNDELEIKPGIFKVDPSAQLKVSFQPFSAKKQLSQLKQSWNDDICSYLFETGELDLKKIGAFMEQLIAQYGNDMLRYKGVLAIHEQENRLIVQGVHKVVGFDYGSPWQDHNERISRLVMISRNNLPFAELKQRFLNCQVQG